MKCKVGIDRLKKYFSSNQRPIAFHVLLTHLNNHHLSALGEVEFAPGCVTALDFVKKLLKGKRGQSEILPMRFGVDMLKTYSGAIITDDIITNALTWISPSESTFRIPTQDLYAPLVFGADHGQKGIDATSHSPGKD